MSESRCLGLLAFSSLSQTENQKIIELGKDIKKQKQGQIHPFRFKLIKLSESGLVVGTWEFFGIRRCTNFIPNKVALCRSCMTRNGKNEEYYSKNHGRVDTQFENKTSKLYGSPIYIDLIQKGWNVDTKEEMFCKMLHEEAVSGLKLYDTSFVDRMSNMAKLKRFRTSASGGGNPSPASRGNSQKSLVIDDSIFLDTKTPLLPSSCPSPSPTSASASLSPLSPSPPQLFPTPLMIQKGIRKISVRRIRHNHPAFEIINSEKYYVHTNGNRIKIPEVFINSVEKYPSKIVSGDGSNDPETEEETNSQKSCCENSPV